MAYKIFQKYFCNLPYLFTWAGHSGLPIKKSRYLAGKRGGFIVPKGAPGSPTLYHCKLYVCTLVLCTWRKTLKHCQARKTSDFTSIGWGLRCTVICLCCCFFNGSLVCGELLLLNVCQLLQFCSGYWESFWVWWFFKFYIFIDKI